MSKKPKGGAGKKNDKLVLDETPYINKEYYNSLINSLLSNFPYN